MWLGNTPLRIDEGADLNGQRCGGMWDLVSYLISMVALIVIVFAIGYGVKHYLSGSLPFGSLLVSPKERRLDVIDHANVDGKRRLLLVRRDNVEHLIMTGGPVDVVIETGIGGQTVSTASLNTERPRQTAAPAATPSASETSAISEPVFTRPARTFGKVVGEN